MGPLTSLLGMIPGLAGHQLSKLQVDEKELDRIEAIILSMTPYERNNPDAIKGSRRLRIAKGSGTSVQQVNQLGQAVRRDAQADARPAAGQDARPAAAHASAVRPCPLPFPPQPTRLLRDDAVSMRLTRVGGKKDPVWRVVVADRRSPRDGRFIETVGRYNAQTDPSTIVLDEERVQHWLDRGAQPSGHVASCSRPRASRPNVR
jgi:ribosomal protein S16